MQGRVRRKAEWGLQLWRMEGGWREADTEREEGEVNTTKDA